MSWFTPKLAQTPFFRPKEGFCFARERWGKNGKKSEENGHFGQCSHFSTILPGNFFRFRAARIASHNKPSPPHVPFSATPLSEEVQRRSQETPLSVGAEKRAQTFWHGLFECEMCCILSSDAASASKSPASLRPGASWW